MKPVDIIAVTSILETDTTMSVFLAARSPNYTSVRGQAAKHVVQDTINLYQDVLLGGAGPQLPTSPEPLPDEQRSTLPICIVGAGCAGLYAAMILDTLDLPYEIL